MREIVETSHRFFERIRPERFALRTSAVFDHELEEAASGVQSDDEIAIHSPTEVTSDVEEL